MTVIVILLIKAAPFNHDLNEIAPTENCGVDQVLRWDGSNIVCDNPTEMLVLAECPLSSDITCNFPSGYDKIYCDGEIHIFKNLQEGNTPKCFVGSSGTCSVASSQECQKIGYVLK